MNAFEKRMALSDVVIGNKFWTVISVTGSFAQLESEEGATFISDPLPYQFSRFIDYQLGYEGVKRCITFANDLNMKHESQKSKPYNFHAAFSNYDDALEYIDMINSDKLPDDLRAVRNELVARSQKNRDTFDDWDY